MLKILIFYICTACSVIGFGDNLITGNVTKANDTEVNKKAVQVLEQKLETLRYFAKNRKKLQENQLRIQQLEMALINKENELDLLKLKLLNTEKRLTQLENLVIRSFTSMKPGNDAFHIPIFQPVKPFTTILTVDKTVPCCGFFSNMFLIYNKHYLEPSQTDDKEVEFQITGGR